MFYNKLMAETKEEATNDKRSLLAPSSNESSTESNRCSFLGNFSLLERYPVVPSPPPVYTPTDENPPDGENTEFHNVNRGFYNDDFYYN